ncbi:MAG: cell division protein FtsQ/DivIB [Flavobacteriales bacterium]
MKIPWGSIKLIFITILIVFIYGFSNQRNEARKITKTTVNFLDENSNFITLNTVNKLLIQKKDSVINIDKETLALNEIEQRLTNNPMIKKADVFISIDGVLGANIKQHNPIARVVSKLDYYLDEEGNKMPLSKVFSARLPLVTGSVTGNQQLLKKLIDKINEDEFMKKSVIGISIKDDASIKLKMRDQNFEIDFGKPIDIEKKFFNYKVFYKKAKKDSTLTSYNLIDLKYNNQVVATKRTTHGGK